MAKNDSILVDGIIMQKVADGIPSDDKGEAFEHFCFEQILKNYDLSNEEIETGWVDGRHDGGIDGFFVFVNGHLVSDATSFPWPRSHARLDIFVISCKHHDTFKESTLNSLLATVHEIFDLSRPESELIGAYSNDILSARRRLAEVYRRLAITDPEMNILFVYASRGDTADIGESVRARSEQITHAAGGFFSNKTVTFLFLGAKELIEHHREAKQFTLELPFQDHLVGTGDGYIVVAKLVDYYRFVCDDEGNLRRYLFDSNVRDYLGDNRVNEDIAASLEDDVAPDFWWLNNGITILTTRAVINGKNMLMQDIQVVNGLQTTETIYRHFSSGSRKSLDRTLAVKIIVSQDEKLRDQIIRATNNQSVVEQASLRATDKIQRDIEQILERYDFYYERRKNYYKNIGRPPARFVTPLFVASACVAIVLKDPAAAATLKSRFMRKQSSYEKIFSDKRPIEVWPRIVAIVKTVEEEMLHAPRDKQGEGFLRSWRGLIGLLFTAKLLGKFDFKEADILKLDVSDIDRSLINDCREFVYTNRSGAISAMWVKRMCVSFARIHSLGGVESVGRVVVGELYPRRTAKVPAIFVDQVDTLLPPQPWPVGIHLEIAEKLGVHPKKVSRAIRRLIDDGRRHEQNSGKVVPKR